MVVTAWRPELAAVLGIPLDIERVDTDDHGCDVCVLAYWEDGSRTLNISYLIIKYEKTSYALNIWDYYKLLSHGDKENDSEQLLDILAGQGT
ncbi:hypothetical protein Tco_0949362 [Tanacetum coccineum]